MYLFVHPCPWFHVMMNELPETKTRKDLRSLKAEEHAVVLAPAPRGFCPGTLVFSSCQKPTFSV